MRGVGKRLCLWLGLVLAGLPWVAAAAQDLQELCPSLQKLAAFDLDNPHIEPNQVESVGRLARQARQCVQQTWESRGIRPSASRQQPLYLLEHFTEDSDPRAASRVALSVSRDPAVLFLKNTLHWPAPPGLVFIRRYQSLEEMPWFVRGGFQRSTTQAVTLGCRYIAILERWDALDKDLSSRFDKRIFSHELTHAYVNSSLGSRRHQLPLWFHEAIAAYASGTGNLDHAIDVAIGPSGIQTTTYDNPMDYQTYALVFQYLKHHLGRDVLHDCLRDCLLQASVDPLLQAAQVRDYQFLVVDARYWQNQRYRKRFWIALSLLAVLAIWVWRHLPQHEQAEENETTAEPQ